MFGPFHDLFNDIQRTNRRQSARGIGYSAGEALECRILPSGVAVLVKDIFPGYSGSNPKDLIAVNSTLFFTATSITANSAIDAPELWKSDGTAVGTVKVKDIYPGTQTSFINELTNFNGTLYFVAISPGHGLELWKSDGTEAGTVMVKEIRPGTAGASVRDLTVVDDRLYFVANDGLTGSELWKSDGTEEGTQRVADIIGGSFGSGPVDLTNVDGTLYFTATKQQIGEESPIGLGRRQIYKADQSGVSQVTFFNPQTYLPLDGAYLESLTESGGQLFFVGETFNDFGSELWTTDGTYEGTTIVKDINSTAALGSDSDPMNLFDVNDTLFFTAFEPGKGRELWTSDGTEGGTYLVKDLTPGDASTTFSSFANYGGRLFFTITRGTDSSELWISNGTEEGTTLVESFPNVAAAAINIGIMHDGLMYFRARDTPLNGELWRSDGTPAGTYQVADTVPGSRGSDPHNFTEMNGNLYFVASSQDDGYELRMLADTALPPTDISLSPQSIVEHNLPGAVVGTLGSNDPDSGNAVVFRLVSGIGSDDNASFSIDGNQLRLNGSADFDIRNQYQIRVRVTDPDQLTFEKQFTVTVTAAVDSPTTITLQQTPLTYPTKTNNPIAIDPTATITDVDTPNPLFAGALLQVSGLRPKKDVASIEAAGSISRKGRKIFFGSTLIGISTGGKGNTLTVQLTSDASLDIVQELLRTISFRTREKTNVDRPISMQITKINNLQTNTATRSVRIIDLA